MMDSCLRFRFDEKQTSPHPGVRGKLAWDGRKALRARRLSGTTVKLFRRYYADALRIEFIRWIIRIRLNTAREISLHIRLLKTKNVVWLAMDERGYIIRILSAQATGFDCRHIVLDERRHF